MGYRLPLLKNVEQVMGHRHRTAGFLSLHSIADLLHYPAFDTDFPPQPINIMPFQPKCFGDAKP